MSRRKGGGQGRGRGRGQAAPPSDPPSAPAALPPGSDRQASRAERILALCDPGLISLPNIELLPRDTRENLLGDLENMQGSSHMNLPHYRIIPILDALATLLVSQERGEIIAVGYIPTQDTSLHLVLAQNGYTGGLQAAEQHLRNICAILQEIRTTRDSRELSNKSPLQNKVPVALASALLNSCYAFSAARVRKRFEKAKNASMLEALAETMLNMNTPGRPESPARPLLRIDIDKKINEWGLILALHDLLSLYKKLGDAAFSAPAFMHKIADTNSLLRVLGHDTGFLDNIVPYYNTNGRYVRYGSKFRRLTDKLLAVDTAIRNILILPYSGSMGRVLDMSQILITQVHNGVTSYLNYDLRTDNEMKVMMDQGVSPMNHAQLCAALQSLPEAKGRKTTFVLDVHAECKLLSYFVDQRIDAYHYIGTSKLACVACWLFFEAHNALVQEENQKAGSRRLAEYRVRGCHSHVYQWSAPAFSLTDRVLEKMATRAEGFFRSLRSRHWAQLSESTAGTISDVSVSLPWEEIDEEIET